LSNRVLSFRAALLLLVSSAVIVWPISYWLPLPNYLAVLNTSEYAQFANAIRGIVIVYFLFMVMTIVSAVLAFTRLDYRIRLVLLGVPTLSLLIAPLVLIIPNSQQFADRDFFTFVQAIFRLMRFTTPTLFYAVVAITLLSFALNAAALVLMLKDKSESFDEMPTETRKSYIALASIVSLATVVALIAGGNAGQSRELNRQACAKYAALAVPELDEEVPAFLSDIQLFGEAAGTDDVKKPMVTFAEKSRLYYSAYNAEEDNSLALASLLAEVRSAKDQITVACTEYSVD
jgi:hypothetical protein